MFPSKLPSAPALRRKWRRTIAEARYGSYDKISRSSARLLFRGLLVLVVLALIFSYHDSRRPEHQRLVRREVITKQLTQRLGPRSNDPRVWPGWRGINTIFAFGDSQTDHGFNVRGPQPDRENPLGNPGFPGRTGSYGANYVGHMTASYNQSFIRTYNLANRLSPFYRKTDTMKMPSFQEQIDGKFLKRYGTSTKPTARSRQGSGDWSYVESLFVLYIGADDIMQTFGDELESKGSVAMEDNLHSYLEGVNKLYDAGARNFLLINYPQLENAPGIKSYGDRVGESKAYWRLGATIVQYNAKLAFMAHMFGEAHPDANVFVFNTHKMSLTVRLEPTRYPETAMYNHLFGYCFPYADNHHWVTTDKIFDPGCTDGLINYLWRDEFHYSEPFQTLMAKQIVQLLESPDQRLPQEFY